MRISIDQISDILSPDVRVSVSSLSGNIIDYRVDIDVNVLRAVSTKISKISLEVLPEGGSNPATSLSSTSSPSNFLRMVASSRNNLKSNASTANQSPLLRKHADPRLALSGKPINSLSNLVKTGRYAEKKIFIFKQVSGADVRTAKTTLISNESALVTSIPDDPVSYGSAAIELAAQGIDVTESLSYDDVVRTTKENVRGLLSKDVQQTRYQPGRLQSVIQQKFQKTAQGFSKFIDLQDSTVAYEVVLQTKYKTETFEFQVDRNQQGIGLGFVLKIDAVDSKGVVCSTRKININHKDKINEFLVPTDVVRIKATRITPGFFKIDANTRDHGITGCEIYVKSLSEGFEEKFGKIGTIDLVSGQGSRVFSIDSDSGLVFRGIPLVSKSISYNNASGDAIVSRTLSTASCAIYTYPERNSPSVNIEILSLRGNASTVSILRRDLTLKEKSFSLVASLPATSGKISYVDNGTKPNHRYEYKCELFDRFQKKVGYSNSRFETVTVSTGEVAATTNVSVDNQGNATLQVSVSGNLDTSTQKLFSLLDNLGGTPVFQDKFKQIYSNFSSISQVSVERFNTLTGESVDLGVFNPGTITDKIPAAGSYKYRVDVLTRSPADLLEELATSDAIRLSTSNKSPNLQASAQLSQTSQKLNFTQKFVNKYSLNMGTLSYSYVQAQNHPESAIDQGKTGVVSTVDVSVRSRSLSITPLEPTVTASNSVILRWRTPDSSLVDHFVIVCERGGSTVVCGIAHPGESQTVQSFVDLTLHNFVGQCRYSMTPVGNGYNINDRISLGIVQIKDNSNAN